MSLSIPPKYVNEDGRIIFRSRIRFKADAESASKLAEMLSSQVKESLPSTEWQKYTYWASETNPGHVVIEIEDIGEFREGQQILFRHEAAVTAQISAQSERGAKLIAPDSD